MLALLTSPGCALLDDADCSRFCRDQGFSRGSSEDVEFPMDLVAPYRECSCFGPGTPLPADACQQFCDERGYTGEARATSDACDCYAPGSQDSS